jgi:glutathione reductase (NADPH)
MGTEAMSRQSYDVIILGGGNAGMGVTVATREAGLKVAMIEARDLGGTCPNRGCTPKKVLVAAGHALHEIERAPLHGIKIDEPSLDWAALIDREKQMVRDIPARLGDLMTTRGVDVLRGRARFAGPNAVHLDGQTLEAAHIVIATGSKPRPLPIPGAAHMITSDDVLNERQRPDRVVFVGGGVIALELGQVYARAGTKVTILEVLPRLLAGFDADAVAAVRAESERIGMTIETGVAVRRVEQVNGRLQVVYEADGAERTIAADRVVNGAGRIADVEGLDLDSGHVAHDGGRLQVLPWLRSASNPAVHVCGDALPDSPQLSPVATYEGRIVGLNIAEDARHEPDYASIPSAVYTVPALASVGLTEEAATAKGLRPKVKTSDMLGWLSSRTYGETAAFAKVLTDPESDRILGAHLVGHAGEELIHLFALAMRHGLTASDLSGMVYGFPTFSADIKSML